MEDVKLPTFPCVNFLVRHGSLVSAVAGLAPLAATIWMFAGGAGATWLVVGFIAAPALWLLMQSYVEVLRILADALMPR